MRRPRWWSRAGTYAALALVAVYVLVPIYGLAYLAFDAGILGWPHEFRFWPEKPSLAAFSQVWTSPSQSLSFLGALRNSLIVSGGAALLAVGFGASLAFAFARMRFPGRQVGLFALLVGAMLPPVALMTPLYVLLTALQIRTTLLGLMIVYAAFGMPLGVWNMRAAFQAVPRELEEAAMLEGATLTTAFLRVTLPLALPSIAIAALMAFLIGYSEFAMGWLFVDKGENVTLAMAIWGMIFSSGVMWSRLAALALLMSLPVVIVFLALQHYLLRGVLYGTVEE